MNEVIDSVRGIERRLVRQHQRLDHVQRPLLVFLEMFGSDIASRGFTARISFEDGYLAGILLSP